MLQQNQIAASNQPPLQAVNSTELLSTISQFSNMPKKSIELLQNLVVADQTLEICRQLAYKLCNTGMVPKVYQMIDKPELNAIKAAESGAVAIMWGCEIGLQPLQALQNVAVINGNPALWGDALVAIVRASPVCEYITTTYDDEAKIATCVAKRVDQPEEIRTFSWDEAVTAGLTTKKESVYMKYGKRMLCARARSYVLRDLFADLLKGFKVREVEEEDQKTIHSEREINPRGKTMTSDLLNKTPEKAKTKTQSSSERPVVYPKAETEPKPKTEPTPKTEPEKPIQAKQPQPAQTETQPPTENATQEQILAFNSYIEGIKIAQPDEMNGLGLQIGAEENITKMQKDLLRIAFKVKNDKNKADFAESEKKNPAG